MAWPPGYRELAPPPALRDTLACLWVRVAAADAPSEDAVRILPDACVDLVWRQGQGTFFAGPDTGPVVVPTRAGEIIVGARFRPGRGGPALGLPLDELRDARLPLDAIWPRLARQLHDGLDAEEALRRLARAATALAAAAPRDPPLRRAVVRLDDPALRVEALAGELGLSERQLRRRCRAAVGYGPKTLQRVLRFRRFLAGLDRLGPASDLAALARDAGYADQAHLTRDCTRLAGLPPGRLGRVRAA